MKEQTQEQKPEHFASFLGISMNIRDNIVGQLDIGMLAIAYQLLGLLEQSEYTLHIYLLA